MHSLLPDAILHMILYHLIHFFSLFSIHTTRYGSIGTRLDCIDTESVLRDDFLIKLLDIREAKFPNERPFDMNLAIPAANKKGPTMRLMQAY